MSEQLIATPGVFGENGNFLLERELGAGGMGGVYMGRDKMLDRPVAVKVMLKELGSDPEFVEKFKKEAQSAARLIHPNIAQIYSYGISEGMPYISMELASGGSLFSIMNANPGKTDVARVIKICQQVAQALQCASDQGFVHGDVKPENILLDANGNAKLVDFGLASMQKETDEIWGTPYYIAPEKVKKESIDFRADMFSLGGTLYHALTGVAPFEGSDPIAVVKKRFEGAPKKPSEVRSDLTPAIDTLVMKMLSVNREDRYPSFEALIEAFKEVLTSGLTAAAAPKPTAAAPAKKPVAGARRLASGRRMMMRKPGGAKTTLRKQDAESGDEGGVKPIVPDLSAADDEEEEGGSLGGKVFLVIFGVILLVGGVIGGLVWYQVADRKARAAEEQAQITAGITKARTAIADTLVSASKFADEFDSFAEKAIVECQKPTDELKRLLPDHAEELKPGPTKELLDAIASTNEVVQAAATNATANATGTNAPPAAAGQNIVQVDAAPAMPKFREPTEDEKDPASPEGEAYLKARKEFYEALVKKLTGGGKSEAAATNETAAAAGAEAPAETPAPAVETETKEEKKPDQFGQVVITMNELWERAYGCKASAIRIRQKVRKLLEKGAEAEAIKEENKESMDKLADLSREVVEGLEAIRGSKDVENVKKGISFIKTKGDKTVAQTVRDIRKAKLEAERKAKAEEEARLEKEKKERQAAERKAKVEEETAAAKAKFEEIVTRGCFRQLDWKSALRLLNSLRESMTTPEGQLACDLEIRKVNDMKMVQDLFIENLKGHEMKGKKLKNCTVSDVNEKEIVFTKKGVKEKIKIPWMKFYKDYPGNLNEIMNAYVVNTRQPNAKVRISSPLKWANAMTGAALTMRLVCPDVTGAIERSEELVKRTIKEFPDYEKTAREIFPDIKLEESTQEE